MGDKDKEGKQMAAPVLKKSQIKFSDFEKFQKFAEYANSKNPATERIQRMLKDRSPIPRRKK